MYDPSPAPLNYTDEGYVEVNIGKGELREITAKVTRWACEDKPGVWGTGLLPDAVRVGLRGETAFASVARLPMDLDPKEYGTGGVTDFEKGGVKMEVKTRKMGSAHRHLLVRYETEGGNEVPLKSDIYVAATVVSATRQPGCETVHLVGWATREDVENAPTVPARRGSHKNKEIAYEDLRPMSELMEVLR